MLVDDKLAKEKLARICEESIAMSKMMGAFEHMRVAGSILDQIRNTDLTDCQPQKVCELCGGTGWLHGAQEWTPERMNQGTPYKSVRCDCKKAKSDE